MSDIIRWGGAKNAKILRKSIIMNSLTGFCICLQIKTINMWQVLLIVQNEFLIFIHDEKLGINQEKKNSQKRKKKRLAIYRFQSLGY